MSAIEAALARVADITNPHGEEIWTNIDPNVALVRLKPGTRSEHHYHKLTKEHYGLLKGSPKLYIDGAITIFGGQIVTIWPLAKHLIINDTECDVTFLVKSDRLWTPDDLFIIE